MHELSIIYSIIEATEIEVQQRDASATVEAIELEIGEMAGVEIDSLEFLWPAAVEQTILEKARCDIRRVPGEASCDICGKVFPVRQYFDSCPQCRSHAIQLLQGEELRIKSLTLLSGCPDATKAVPQNWN